MDKVLLYCTIGKITLKMDKVLPHCAAGKITVKMDKVWYIVQILPL